MGHLNSLIGWNCFISFPLGPYTHFFLELSKARKDTRQSWKVERDSQMRLTKRSLTSPQKERRNV